MNPIIRDRWIVALESGNYQQATGRLRRADGFCCLGVLCDIVTEEIGGKWVERGVGENGLVDFDFVTGDGRHANQELPPKVADYAGLDSRDPMLGSDSASVLNDTGWTFSKIAQFIRARL